MSRNVSLSTTTPPNYGSITSTSNAQTVQNRDELGVNEYRLLSDNIAQHLNNVNSTCLKLQKTLKVLSNPKNWRQQQQNEIHSLNLNTNKEIELISKDLQCLNVIKSYGDKQQKLQVEKLTKDFQSLVGNYSSLQKKVADGMRRACLLNATEQLNPQNEALNEAANESRLLQEQIEAGLQVENSILEEREKQIKEIEADILDINDIMKKVAQILHDQADSVARIETNIESAAADVEQAETELAYAATHRRSHRRKIIYIVVFAIIIAIIVTTLIFGKINN